MSGKWGFALKIFKVALAIGAMHGAKVKGIDLNKIAQIERAIEGIVTDRQAAKKKPPPKPTSTTGE